MKLLSDSKTLARITVNELDTAYGTIHGGNKKYRDNDTVSSIINQASRAVIRSMRPCFIGCVNLYGEDRGKKESILKEYKKGMVFNFGGSFVIPAYDEELVELILARDTAPYTGTADDAVRVNAIYDRLEQLGAKTLHWE